MTGHAHQTVEPTICPRTLGPTATTHPQDHSRWIEAKQAAAGAVEGFAKKRGRPGPDAKDRQIAKLEAEVERLRRRLETQDKMIDTWRCRAGQTSPAPQTTRHLGRMRAVRCHILRVAKRPWGCHRTPGRRRPWRRPIATPWPGGTGRWGAQASAVSALDGPRVLERLIASVGAEPGRVVRHEAGSDMRGPSGTSGGGGGGVRSLSGAVPSCGHKFT